MAYCSRATVAHLVQKFERTESVDYLKITNNKDFKPKLNKFLQYPHAMEACRYCLGTSHLHLIKPASPLLKNNQFPIN